MNYIFCNYIFCNYIFCNYICPTLIRQHNYMETPFVFGRIATDRNFTDREQETALLVQNFTSLINTIIISPRRWGKSSLVNKAAQLATANDSKLIVCQIDLFNVRSEEHFYSLLAQKVISETSTKWEEAVETAKHFFIHLVPKISIGADSLNEISIDFDWNRVKQNPDEILDLAEKIAKEKGIKFVICLDEFQNIAEFTNPDYFQKRLRAHWQQHQNVAYCLYGSKRHMMMEVFTNYSKPFYKFGSLIFLNKISSSYLTAFFKTRFSDTGKDITNDAAALIASLSDNHPYYAQQLAQLSWLRTPISGVCETETVHIAHTSLIEQLSLLFVNITETFSMQQLNYLKALVSGETAITSTSVMHRYGISSATSAVRSKEALIKHDILDNSNGTISFQDPIYAYWLKTQYFGLSLK